MTSTEHKALITHANSIGQPYKVRCTYRYLGGKFSWCFYRDGIFIGKTSKQDKVITMMNNFITTKGE